MSDFDKAIEYLFKNEGGLTDDPQDSGGVTCYGVTLDLLKEYPIDANGNGKIDVQDIKMLSKDDAKLIWDKVPWEKYHYYDILNQDIATKIFDLSANLGPIQSHIIAQRACYANGWDLKIDGILGPKTMMAINTIDSNNLLVGLKCEAAGVYRLIVYKRSILEVFLKGWLNRAYN